MSKLYKSTSRWSGKGWVGWSTYSCTYA